MARLLNDEQITDLEIELVLLKKQIRAARLRLAEIDGLFLDDDRRKENEAFGRKKAKAKPR